MLPSDNACCLETRELLISLQSFQKFLNRPDANAVYRAAPCAQSGTAPRPPAINCVNACTACGHKGATIQHPGWGGANIGFLPFPVGHPWYDEQWPTALDAIERERWDVELSGASGRLFGRPFSEMDPRPFSPLARYLTNASENDLRRVEEPPTFSSR